MTVTASGATARWAHSRPWNGQADADDVGQDAVSLTDVGVPALPRDVRAMHLALRAIARPGSAARTSAQLACTIAGSSPTPSEMFSEPRSPTLRPPAGRRTRAAAREFPPARHAEQRWRCQRLGRGALRQVPARAAQRALDHGIALDRLAFRAAALAAGRPVSSVSGLTHG